MHCFNSVVQALASFLALTTAIPLPFDTPSLLPLQQSISRLPTIISAPGISPIPNEDRIGVRFRVRSTTYGRWAIVDVFFRPGRKMHIEEFPELPSKPESVEIISVPASGLRVRRACVVHTSTGNRAIPAVDGLVSEAVSRRPEVTVSDEDGVVSLYRHAQGAMAEEQDVVAYTCF